MRRLILAIFATIFMGAANAQPEPPVQTPGNVCLAPEQLFDEDGDVARNRAALASPDLCLRLEVFREGGLQWVLQVIQNKKRARGPLWAVPHDDEDVAFDSAVGAVLRYGGTVVAVERNHDRYNRPLSGKKKQDPNRNFDIGQGAKCRFQLSRSPNFTRRFLKWLPKGQPIIALHTNKAGYDIVPETDEDKSKGNVSIGIERKPDSHITEYPAPRPIRSRSPDDTLIYVASRRPPGADRPLTDFVAALNRNGIHVLYEHVEDNYCSLSNYAVSKGIPYANLEVVDDDDTGAQLRMIEIVMKLIRQGLGPRP
jgi:hypothetical protein